MNLHALISHRLAPKRFAYGPDNVILYALGVGAGSDPLNPTDLRLVYEKGLRVLPTYASVLAQPNAWIRNPAFEVNYFKLLHGEQGLRVYRPLPPEAQIEASFRVPAVVDKGHGRGALVYFQKEIKDVVTGEVFCTVTSTLFLREDGGCGSFGVPPPPLSSGGPQEVGFVEELAIPRGAALLYRLNGDRNPLHVDPEVARSVGFDRPILHGLCTYGIAGYLLAKAVCGGDPRRLTAMDVRFAAPVFPGETIRVEGHVTGEGVRFRATVPASGEIVLTNGFAEIAPPA